MMEQNETTFVLPPLRQDLKIMPGPAGEDGGPRWLLQDTARNQFYTLAEDACHIIRHWRPGMDLASFTGHLHNKGGSQTADEVAGVVRFLVGSSLVQICSEDDTNRLYRQYCDSQKSPWKWLLHNYLFIRIPLCRPDAWLERIIPRIGWLFSRFWQQVVLALGGFGLLLVIRQWESFLATFQHFFSLEGLLLFGLTLVLVKSAHEMGHAFAAKRHGCRVSSMGVAFLVMFPVLYTDTTDAWRLTSRRARLDIVTAGIRVELYLALLATFLWSLVPEGSLKSMLFFVATTSWVTSLLVNISPFMRFDGYYALSDWLGIENLQQRGFAVGRWYLRKVLFGLHDPLPEPLARERVRILVAYAWGTWLYRFLLFLGIALLVYHFFFKVLGIFLFLVEIAWFIVLPIWNETRTWWQRRADFTPGMPQKFLQGALAIAVLMAVLPLPTRITVPAVLKSEQTRILFAPESAKVQEVPVRLGETVAQGQRLFTLVSDQLLFERLRLKEEIHQVHIHLRRQAGSVREREKRAVHEQTLKRLEEKWEGLQARMARMEVRAPFAGVITEMSDLHTGMWVKDSSPLMAVTGAESLEIEGYIRAPDRNLTQLDGKGAFIADNGLWPAVPVTVATIDIGAAQSVPLAELTSVFEGRIAVRSTDQGVLVPEHEHYRVMLKPVNADNNREQKKPVKQPGVVVLSGDASSWLWNRLRRAGAVLVRESGF